MPLRTSKRRLESLVLREGADDTFVVRSSIGPGVGRSEEDSVSRLFARNKSSRQRPDGNFDDCCGKTAMSAECGEGPWRETALIVFVDLKNTLFKILQEHFYVHAR